jgi:hypothetical protein
LLPTKKASSKAAATTASVQRINSAFEYNDSTLQSLDEEDIRGSSAQREPVQRSRRPAAGLTKLRIKTRYYAIDSLKYRFSMDNSKDTEEWPTLPSLAGDDKQPIVPIKATDGRI